MKIGYPCINTSMGSKSNRTFRLKSYSEKRLVKTVEENLKGLCDILHYNLRNNMLFFRITSDLVPFASHPVCEFDWKSFFSKDFSRLGRYIKDNNMRISVHPDQFIVLNSIHDNVLENSLRELRYHADVLDLLELDKSAKIQLHVGGVYGDKLKSTERFIKRYNQLDAQIKKRLVIENDDKSYTLADCLAISAETGVPVLFDVFHHELNNSGETLHDAFKKINPGWQDKDGIPMVDYSAWQPGKLRVKHADSLTPDLFERFLKETEAYDFDIMLEIKDKEKSALKAIQIAKKDSRFIDAKPGYGHT